MNTNGVPFAPSSVSSMLRALTAFGYVAVTVTNAPSFQRRVHLRDEFRRLAAEPFAIGRDCRRHSLRPHGP